MEGIQGRVAILSDVHGNLEALDAVLEDIKYQNRDIEKGKLKGEKIKHIWFLGDAVGYGPNPVECLQRIVDNCDIVLAGNHELATRSKIENPTSGIFGFEGLGARKGIHWTVRQIYGDIMPIQAENEEIEKYTQGLIANVRADDYRERLARKLSSNLKLNGIPLSFGQRFSGQVEVPPKVLEDVFNDAKASARIKEFYAELERIEKGNKWLKYLSGLKVQHRVGSVLLVHDNEKEPGDMKYMLAPDNAHKTAHAYLIDDEVFERLKKQGITYLFFGHSHFPGTYTSDKYPGIKVVNVGTAGIPREEFFATYVIWNPEAKPPHDTKLVKLELDKWQETSKKMVDAGLPDKLGHAHDVLVKGGYKKPGKELDLS
jgi:predicted phosphodiesterase